MKLIIGRDQKRVRGPFGTGERVGFLISCELRFTAEEESLVARYRAGDHILTRIGDEENTQDVTVADLMRGAEFKCEDVAGLFRLEEDIKTACQGFRVLLDVMQSFGGKEEIEF